MGPGRSGRQPARVRPFQNGPTWCRGEPLTGNLPQQIEVPQHRQLAGGLPSAPETWDKARETLLSGVGDETVGRAGARAAFSAAGDRVSRALSDALSIRQGAGAPDFQGHAGASRPKSLRAFVQKAASRRCPLAVDSVVRSSRSSPGGCGGGRGDERAC